MKVKANGTKINLLMAKQMLSYTELAKLAKMSITTIRGAAEGATINHRTLGKLANALSVEPEEIILVE